MFELLKLKTIKLIYKKRYSKEWKKKQTNERTVICY